jgi:hypothetical protein
MNPQQQKIHKMQEDTDETVTITIPNDMNEIRLFITHKVKTEENNHDDDIRSLLNNENICDSSWRQEEEDLAKRGVYNWYMIRDAIRNQSPTTTTTTVAARTIEEVNLFDGLNINNNSVGEEMKGILQKSIPITLEYWRRVSHEQAMNSQLPQHIKYYQTPQLRIRHRIQAPDPIPNQRSHKK